MSAISLDPKNILAAAAKIPAGEPVIMINLVQFHKQAQYEDPDQTPCSGMEAYLQRYAPAFNEVAAAEKVEGIEVVYAGSVAQTILGPAEPEWDLVAVVRYPNFAALRKVIESPLYVEKAAPHRKAALKAWEFIATVQPAS